MKIWKKNHKTVKKRKNKNEKERSISENPKKTQKLKVAFLQIQEKKKQTPKLKTPFFEKQKKKAFVTTIGVGVKEVIWKIEMEK